MAVLASFIKQPADVQDYDIDFSKYLDAIDDTADRYSVTTGEGLNIDYSQLVDKRIKVWVSGGISGTVYKVTVTLTTFGGRTKQVEIKIKVKEY